MLYLLNTCIVPNDGTYTRKTISIDEAKDIVAESTETQSAIGHQAAAEQMSKDIGFNVLMQRIEIYFTLGDKAICLMLRRRQAEGTILSGDQMKNTEYDYVLLERIA